MFTVCPKCALTLVVTAQDLRVAQGYVRCGRCSNVFNAIVGLTDDRGALAQSALQGTATTSIIRKAPSISDDEPGPQDTLGDTGETEAVYAEPDANEVKFQEVFAEPAPQPRSTARTPAPTPAPTPETRTPGGVSFVAPPPAPPVKATPKALDAEKRYSDTEGIDTYPESELEFNPDLTDVTKVFVEAAPVTFKGDATGKFRKFVMGEEQRDPNAPASSATGAQGGTRSPAPAGASVQGRGNAPAANGAASSARSQTAGAQTAPSSNATGSYAPGFNSGAANAGTSNGAAPGAKPGSARSTPASPAPAARAPSPPPPPPAPPPRDDEDVEIDSELRSLAARLDGTANRPAPQFPPSAANDEGVEREADDDEGGGLGDIYAKAVPRPRPPPPPPAPPPNRTTPARRAPQNTYADENDDLGADMSAADADADMQAVDSAIDTFTPASPPRQRFMWWVAGAAVLSVVLVGQAIHHNRHSLATNALLNRPLTKFYKAIGVPLVPNWDLRSYDVRQLGASSNEGGDGTLTVRASLKNNSTQPLPLPLLRITMQDRYGNRIATRDVPPTGYAPGALPTEAHLGVGQRIDAEMTFKDPGQNAVGFEIDACLATASGRIACANDQTPALR